jgi:hypothetical protein
MSDRDILEAPEPGAPGGRAGEHIRGGARASLAIPVPAPVCPRLSPGGRRGGGKRGEEEGHTLLVSAFQEEEG